MVHLIVAITLSGMDILKEMFLDKGNQELNLDLESHQWPQQSMLGH